MNLESVQKILNEAVWAPSGDNSQPWRFKIEGNTVTVINVPLNHPLYNPGNIADFIAIGALIQNIEIAASHYNLPTSVRLFPDSGSTTEVARIVFEEAQIKSEMAQNLYEAIRVRCSNRKPYHSKDVSQEVLKQLQSLVGIETSVSLQFVTDRNSIKTVASLTSINEQVVLRNQLLHQHLFKTVTWNVQEDEKRHGFFIDTFEFNFVQKLAFRLFQNWNLLRLCNKLFRVATLISKDVARVNEKSAAFGVISIKTLRPDSFVHAGILLQKVWLTATSLGLSMQMTTGVPFLKVAIQGERDILDKDDERLVLETSKELTKVLQCKENDFMLVFRLGYADSPSGRTTRHPPRIEIISA